MTFFHLYMLRTSAFLLDQFRATFEEPVQHCFLLVKRQIEQTTAFTFKVFPNFHFWQLTMVLVSCIAFEKPSWSTAPHTEAEHTQQRLRSSHCTLLFHGCSRTSALDNTATVCLAQRHYHTQGGSTESWAEQSQAASTLGCQWEHTSVSEAWLGKKFVDTRAFWF